jgi:antitoxin component YwqK of YwqJK toxin-antitoxin module
MENSITIQIDDNGTKWWYKNGILHRDGDLPSVEFVNGTKWWYKDGKPHREKGPAVDREDNYRQWYNNGLLHREDGPALECSISKEWYINNLLHRNDGPAIEWYEGSTDWAINGKILNKVPKYLLINYARRKNYTLADLRTDSDPTVVASVKLYKWKDEDLK